tara:strand:+ start:888 stop:1685 length:798 start_codon:yes stop_codon:yes gene_type:complete
MNFLHNNNQKLEEIINSCHDKYINAEPFPHIVLDKFFNEEVLYDIINEFPSNIESIGIKYDTDPEQKLSLDDPNKFGKNTKQFFNYINSYEFLNFINKISGIKETLIADPHLWGGGLHELRNKGYLNIHADFNKHPQTGLDRRVNALVYLNPDWKEEYGGSLQLWDRDMKKCIKKINPIFNRLVVFNTNDYSFHGNPDPIIHPDKNTSRKSIALFYYSNGRPKSDLLGSPKSTNFQNRPNTKDSKKITTYKKLFWKLFYKTKIEL